MYHLFNPGYKIPLYGVLQGGARFVTYDPTSRTAKDFQVPSDRGTFSLRSGLRFGGRPPTLFPNEAMELSVWYEGSIDAIRSSRRGAHAVGLLLQLDLGPAKEAYLNSESPGLSRGLKRVLGN